MFVLQLELTGRLFFATKSSLRENFYQLCSGRLVVTQTQALPVAVHFVAHAHWGQFNQRWDGYTHSLAEVFAILFPNSDRLVPTSMVTFSNPAMDADLHDLTHVINVASVCVVCWCCQVGASCCAGNEHTLRPELNNCFVPTLVIRSSSIEESVKTNNVPDMNHDFGKFLHTFLDVRRLVLIFGAFPSQLQLSASRSWCR